MPNCEGRFDLYLDMSKFAMGSALYQIQNGKPKLIAYASKRLPEAARIYLITELELCTLAINIASFSYLIKRVDFDAIVDHLALTHIFKSKVELATNRIKRLLELINSYLFNLYYIKGKDMILSDFVPRQKHDNSNPHDIMLISFNMHYILHKRYCNRVSTLNFPQKGFLKGSILKIKGFWPENKGFSGKLKGFTCGKKRFFTACNSNKNSNK